MRYAILALILTGCGAEVELPPLVGNVDGIEYYASPDLDITLEGMTEQVTLTAKAWGVPLSRFSGLKVAYSATPFSCGERNPGDVTGCYVRGRYISIQLWARHRCAYIVPIAHEMWHHIGYNGEPDAAERDKIEIVSQHVNQVMLPKYCADTVFPE